MRWGFGLRQGPFELWQEAGWKQVAQWIADDIASGKALASAPLPAWVTDGPVAEKQAVHTAEGSWSPSQKRYVPRSTLPVYERQRFPETVMGSGAPEPLKSGTELYKNEEIRVWTPDNEIAIASITASNAIEVRCPVSRQGFIEVFFITCTQGLVCPLAVHAACECQHQREHTLFNCACTPPFHIQITANCR
jgi:3-hydroxyacyl-CoA dehydrogenase